jgi:hypothetical protein
VVVARVGEPTAAEPPVIPLVDDEAVTTIMELPASDGEESSEA